MNNQLKLIKILRKGIIEIRILSTLNGGGDLKRINRLSNILHNIPDAILDNEKFDFSLLKHELEIYIKNYPENPFNYLEIFQDN